MTSNERCFKVSRRIEGECNCDDKEQEKLLVEMIGQKLGVSKETALEQAKMVIKLRHEARENAKKEAHVGTVKKIGKYRWSVSAFGDTVTFESDGEVPDEAVALAGVAELRNRHHTKMNVLDSKSAKEQLQHVMENDFVVQEIDLSVPDSI